MTVTVLCGMQMARNTKATGSMINCTEGVDTSSPMATVTKVNFNTVSLRATGNW